MRVLIYPEPHPIRGSHILFDHVVRRFLPSLRGAEPDFDVRVFTTAAMVERLGENVAGSIAARLIHPTPEEERLFARNLLEWETDGIPAWLSLMAGGEVADDYVDVLRRIWNVFPFDVIVHWAENGAVTRFVEGRPVTRVALELGCTRDPFLSTVVMDPLGTNGSALVPRLSLDDIGDIVGDNPLSAEEALAAYSSSLESVPYEQQFLPLGEDLSAQLLRDGRKIAFLPLQIHDDANLLRFSPYDTVEDVVLDIVPKLAGAGYRTIIKTHPGSWNRAQSRLAFSLARAALRPWADDIVWLDSTKETYSNAQLAALAELVVTVNSSIGFEALYFDKVVAVMGDAVYKPSGLFPTLSEAISGEFDIRAYRHGIGLLRRFMLDGYLIDDTALRSDQTVKEVITAIDALRRRHGSDPVALARGMYESFSVTRGHRARQRFASGDSVPGEAEFEPSHQTIGDEAEGGSGSEAVFALAARRLLGATGAGTVEELRAALDAGFSNSPRAVDLVRASGIVDPAFYLGRYRDVAKAGKDPVDHWTRFGLQWERHGLRGARAPRADMEIGSVAQFIDALVEAARPLLDGEADDRSPLGDDVAAARASNLASVRKQLVSRDNRVAVVAHLPYRSLAPEVLEWLSVIPEPFDLIVTTPSWGTDTIASLVHATYPNAVIYPDSGRGRDIGAFLDMLPILLNRPYDAILRLHTKIDFYPGGRLSLDLGAKWLHETLSALLGSTERVSVILESLRSDGGPGAVGVAPHYVSFGDHPYTDEGVLAEGLVVERKPEGWFLGSALWFRPEVLRPFIGPGAPDVASFPTELDGGELYGLLERLLSHAAGTMVGAPVNQDESLVTGLEPHNTDIERYLVGADAERGLTSGEADASSSAQFRGLPGR
ncbi:rhamnan synthesis F family protein [Microbacterium sp. NPDC056234]|uniref:rhamnan synthesis F family protein n=1 Tax=Microbacterium sp. NPDC056234 TaxID=3345757 RepID=UPI0035DB70EA